MRPGEKVQMKGYITQNHYLAGKSCSRLESLLGFKAGRLSGGWALLALTQLPKPDDFEFRGYSYLSGGMEKGHDSALSSGKTMEVKLKDGNFDLAKLKAAIIKNTFSVSGSKRLVRVVPKDPPSGNKDYPPGLGVPQWELIRKLGFVVLGIMEPGGTKWVS